ncbi:translation initiation factor IF-3 [Rothia kristinae]|uniref:translation initiation factor IF-3 n=1 Tax=Rothia kristinae TaxID=37923 RepID=UPI001E37A5AE
MVGPSGEQVGIVRVEDALRLARESDLDLVEVAPNARPPVCKLMDFGKYKYEAAVKARESRKNQTNTVLKEVRFRLKIDDHDYETKVGHAKRFLTAGDKVKAMIQFRGREQQRPEMGVRLLERLATDLAEVGSVESNPRQDGRNMVMVIGPLRNKAEARREQQRQAKQQGGSRRQRERVDTRTAQPVSNSVAAAMPEQLRQQAQGGSASQAQEAPAPKPQAESKPASAPKPQAAPEAPGGREARVGSEAAGRAEAPGGSQAAGAEARPPVVAAPPGSAPGWMTLRTGSRRRLVLDVALADPASAA